MRNTNTRIFTILGIVTAINSLGSPAHAQCANSSQTPLTSSRLRQIALAAGIINNTQSTLTQNRRVGRSFQEFVQRSMGYAQENGTNFGSPARSAATGNQRTRVRPDFTERVSFVNPSTGQTQTDTQGSFVEVKATGAVLRPSYYYYQILGHIDAVSRQPAARFFSGAARVLFITTSDTSVGHPATLSEANDSNRRVSIWKATVCEIPSTSTPVDLQVGPAIPLNPSVYPATRRPVNGAPGRINSIARPGTAPAGYDDANGGF